MVKQLTKEEAFKELQAKIEAEKINTNVKFATVSVLPTKKDTSFYKDKSELLPFASNLLITNVDGSFFGAKSRTVIPCGITKIHRSYYKSKYDASNPSKPDCTSYDGVYPFTPGATRVNSVCAEVSNYGNLRNICPKAEDKSCRRRDTFLFMDITPVIEGTGEATFFTISMFGIIFSQYINMVKERDKLASELGVKFMDYAVSLYVDDFVSSNGERKSLHFSWIDLGPDAYTKFKLGDLNYTALKVADENKIVFPSSESESQEFSALDMTDEIPFN